jgi:hypothetical protein
MAKVHYPCGGWANSAGAHAACVRKCFKNPTNFDGRASHLTCKKCLRKAISKGSQWNSIDQTNTVTVERINPNKDVSGRIYVDLDDGDCILLDDFTAKYQPRL